MVQTNQQIIQAYLDEYDSCLSRKKVTWLYLKEKKSLTGLLDLSDFPNLEDLDCSENELTEIDASNCPRLIKLDCSSNPIVNLKLAPGVKLEEINVAETSLEDLNFLTQLDPLSLRKFWLYDCEVIGLNLNVFSHLINLEELNICGYWNGSPSNNFSGSLKAFSNCQQLKNLDVSGQDYIQADLEYLPNSLEKFGFVGNQEIAEKLETYDNDIQAWREHHPILITNTKVIDELTEVKDSLQQIFASLINWTKQTRLAYQALANPNDGFMIWVNEEIRILKQEIVEEQAQIKDSKEEFISQIEQSSFLN